MILRILIIPYFPIIAIMAWMDSKAFNEPFKTSWNRIMDMDLKMIKDKDV